MGRGQPSIFDTDPELKTYLGAFSNSGDLSYGDIDTGDIGSSLDLFNSQSVALREKEDELLGRAIQKEHKLTTGQTLASALMAFAPAFLGKGDYGKARGVAIGTKVAGDYIGAMDAREREEDQMNLLASQLYGKRASRSEAIEQNLYNTEQRDRIADENRQQSLSDALYLAEERAKMNRQYGAPGRPTGMERTLGPEKTAEYYENLRTTAASKAAQAGELPQGAKEAVAGTVTRIDNYSKLATMAAQQKVDPNQIGTLHTELQNAADENPASQDLGGLLTRVFARARIDPNSPTGQYFSEALAIGRENAIAQRGVATNQDVAQEVNKIAILPLEDVEVYNQRLNRLAQRDKESLDRILKNEEFQGRGKAKAFREGYQSYLPATPTPTPPPGGSKMVEVYTDSGKSKLVPEEYARSQGWIE